MNVSWIGPERVAADVEKMAPSKEATILDMCGGSGEVAKKVAYCSTGGYMEYAEGGDLY